MVLTQLQRRSRPGPHFFESHGGATGGHDEHDIPARPSTRLDGQGHVQRMRARRLLGPSRVAQLGRRPALPVHRQAHPPMTTKRATKRKAGASLPKTADVLFGKIVRAPGRCIECGGSNRIQCAHGFSRRYRAARWDTRNAFPLCAGCHFKFTVRPLEWDEWLRDRWGAELYDELRALALRGPLPDMNTLVRDLRDRVEGSGS